METPFRYRNKAQFPVQMRKGEPVIGFYKKKSHEVIPTAKCMIQHELNDEIIEVVREFIVENNISVYDEVKHKGLLRHIVTKIGFTTGEVMVVLVAKKISII